MRKDREVPQTTSAPVGVEPCYFGASKQEPPVDQERAEDAFDIPLGSVVTSAETGKPWVFFGWSSNTAGTYPNFIEALTPARFPGMPRYDYHAAFADTLERKFPDVSRFRKRCAED